MNFLIFKILGGLTALALVFSVVQYVQHLRGTISHQQDTITAQEINIAGLKETIRQMTVAQKEQTDTSETTVVKVVQGPEKVHTIIKTIHDAPLPANCVTPPLTTEAKDML